MNPYRPRKMTRAERELNLWGLAAAAICKLLLIPVSLVALWYVMRGPQ